MSQSPLAGEYSNCNVFSNYHLDERVYDPDAPQAALVPHAVEEAGGFAGSCETATKTSSLIDRPEALTLPAPEDVRDGVERHEKATELDEQIERTDALIDELVYELYGLIDGEIEIVEEAVGE